MNANSARRMARRAFNESLKKQTERQIQDRKNDAKRLSKEIKDGFDRALICVNEAAKVGNFSVEVEVESQHVADNVAGLLRNNGFESWGAHNAVATGVDDWEDRYIVRIEW